MADIADSDMFHSGCLAGFAHSGTELGAGEGKQAAPCLDIIYLPKVSAKLLCQEWGHGNGSYAVYCLR